MALTQAFKRTVRARMQRDGRYRDREGDAPRPGERDDRLRTPGGGNQETQQEPAPDALAARQPEHREFLRHGQRLAEEDPGQAPGNGSGVVSRHSSPGLAPSSSRRWLGVTVCLANGIPVLTAKINDESTSSYLISLKRHEDGILYARCMNEHEQTCHKPKPISLYADSCRTSLLDQVVNLRQISDDDQGRSEKTDPSSSIEHIDLPLLPGGEIRPDSDYLPPPVTHHPSLITRHEGALPPVALVGVWRDTSRKVESDPTSFA
jgi:hypothetical protein